MAYSSDSGWGLGDLASTASLPPEAWAPTPADLAWQSVIQSGMPPEPSGQPGPMPAPSPPPPDGLRMTPSQPTLRPEPFTMDDASPAYRQHFQAQDAAPIWPFAMGEPISPRELSIEDYWQLLDALMRSGAVQWPGTPG